jgi:hypothetical protein
MKIEIKDFSTAMEKGIYGMKRYDEIITLIEQGHSVKLFLPRSDFIAMEIYRARNYLPEEYTVKEDYVLDTKYDDRVYTTISIEMELEE